jgi:hypothetical protein
VRRAKSLGDGTITFSLALGATRQTCRLTTTFQTDKQALSYLKSTGQNWSRWRGRALPWGSLKTGSSCSRCSSFGRDHDATLFAPSVLPERSFLTKPNVAPYLRVCTTQRNGRHLAPARRWAGSSLGSPRLASLSSLSSREPRKLQAAQQTLWHLLPITAEKRLFDPHPMHPSLRPARLVLMFHRPNTCHRSGCSEPS